MIVIHPSILIGLAICMGMLVLILFDRYIIKMCVQGIVGVMCVMGINWMIPVAYQVTIDFISIGIMAVVGIPGVILLYILQFIQVTYL